jgi:signal peptidase I
MAIRSSFKISLALAVAGFAAIPFAWSKSPFGQIKSYFISSENNLPTFRPGDFLAVISYSDAEEVKRGDMVVYEYTPEPNSTVSVARVIGLPGETFEMRNGRAIINGQPLVTAPIKSEIEAGCEKNLSPGLACRYVRETTPEGVSYVILDLVDGSTFDNTAPRKIPQDGYLLLGDNRDNSNDSRSKGTTPRADILGKVRMIYLCQPPDNRQQRLNGFPGLE